MTSPLPRFPRFPAGAPGVETPRCRLLSLGLAIALTGAAAAAGAQSNPRPATKAAPAAQTPPASRPAAPAATPSANPGTAAAATTAPTAAPTAATAPSALAPAGPRLVDHIVAVVNQESVTDYEVRDRMARIRAEAARSGERLPPEAELKRQVLDALIDERALLSQAREVGVRVDDAEVDRAVANIAAQNQITVAVLRERLAADGLDLSRFRANIRDQLMVERLREREVVSRIRITDAEVESFIEKQRGSTAGEVEYNIAQILVTVPDGASESVVAERRARAEAARQRVLKGEDFAAVARAVSEDGNRERGGELGLRVADRLPDLFLEAVRPLKPGDMAPALVRSGAGFHVLRLVERRDAAAFRTVQTRARHILLRLSGPTSREAAVRQMNEWRSQIESGRRRFEDLARERSEDGSAPQGGDLGWTTAGAFVPEFEDAMNRLPVGGLSAPVVSRFGVHLIQVVDRREVALDTKQLREQARNALREQKFEEAYTNWVKESRNRAYVELREAPVL